MSTHRVAVLKVVSAQSSVTAAAAEYGFSRQHLQRLLRRYREGGLEAVEPRSRRPRPAHDGEILIAASMDERERIMGSGRQRDAVPVVAEPRRATGDKGVAMGRILRLVGRLAGVAMLVGIVLALAWLLRQARAGRRGGAGELPPWRGPAWFRQFVTHRFDPLVMDLGLVGGHRSPWAMVEHVGRRSGTVRRTPILPHIVGDHVLVPLPYGRAAHWVRNIQASGHCRMQLHEHVYELDEPQVLAPDAVTELPAWQRGSALQGRFEFLRLRVFRTLPGTLDSVPAHAPGVTAERGQAAVS